MAGLSFSSVSRRSASPLLETSQGSKPGGVCVWDVWHVCMGGRKHQCCGGPSRLHVHVHVAVGGFLNSNSKYSQKLFYI